MSKNSPSPTRHRRTSPREEKFLKVLSFGEDLGEAATANPVESLKYE